MKKQEEADEKLLTLVETMVDIYSFVEDIALLDLPDKIKSLEDQVLAIVKQTVECSLFIQEYTATGFCGMFGRWRVHRLISAPIVGRALRNLWTNKDKEIDELSDTLCKLKDTFYGRLTTQGLFLSTKVLGQLERLGS